LVDSCFRMNVVALAKEKMAEREPIACYDDLHQLVVDLLSMINTMPKEVRLEEAPEADIIFDINVGTCPPPKQLKTVNLILTWRRPPPVTAHPRSQSRSLNMAPSPS